MIIALMCSSFVFALPYDLKINNICYKIIGNEAMVTVPSDIEEQNHRFYTGKIDIPETISYGPQFTTCPADRSVEVEAFSSKTGRNISITANRMWIYKVGKLTINDVS